MPEKRAVGVVLVLRRLQSSTVLKDKCLMCFMDLEKTFLHILKDGIGMVNEAEGSTGSLIRSVISLHDEAKTTVRVDSELSEEFESKVVMLQVPVLSPFYL